MFFLKGIEYSLRILEKRPVSDEWRGWNYLNENLVPPRYGPKLPMYIVASEYCPTGRDVFLEKVRREVGIKTRPMVEGHLYHVLYDKLIRTSQNYVSSKNRNIEALRVETYLKGRRNGVISDIIHSERVENALNDGIISRRVLNQIKRNMEKLWNYEAKLLGANVFFHGSHDPQINIETLVSKAIPFSSNRQIDGSNLSLSERLTLDAITTMPNRRVIIDLKTGRREEFHRLTTTGYALAWESIEGEQVDLGCIMYLDFISTRPSPRIECDFHPITNELRSRFIEARNEKMIMIASEKDPGFAGDCPPDCPYFNVCERERT